MKPFYQITSDETGIVTLRRRKIAKALRWWLRENRHFYKHTFFVISWCTLLWYLLLISINPFFWKICANIISLSAIMLLISFVILFFELLYLIYCPGIGRVIIKQVVLVRVVCWSEDARKIKWNTEWQVK